MPDKWRLFLIELIACIFIQSFAFAQDTQYQPLISGMEHYKNGKYKEALEDFQKAIVVFPDDPDIPFYMGLTYLQLNEPEKAIEYFKMVKVSQ
ncbi:MAG: tetratricopeptide repeat protein [Nanoarchaeota archaeon]|nr:tetratricopeptide repeat protein [Nanoarchaeota archaeon]